MLFFLAFVALVIVGIILVAITFPNSAAERGAKVGLVAISVVLTLMCSFGEWDKEWNATTAEFQRYTGNAASAQGIDADPGLDTSAPLPTVVIVGRKLTITSPPPKGLDHVKIQFTTGGVEKNEILRPGQKREFTLPDDATDVQVQWQDREGLKYSYEAPVVLP